MSEEDVKSLISTAIISHERRVGFISGVIGGVWLSANVAVLLWVVYAIKHHQ